MAHLECYRETETAIFATRTNLPVSDFQTWCEPERSRVIRLVCHKIESQWISQQPHLVPRLAQVVAVGVSDGDQRLDRVDILHLHLCDRRRCREESEPRQRLHIGISLQLKKDKGIFLYRTVSSPLDRSKRSTLFLPWQTCSTSLGTILATQQLHPKTINSHFHHRLQPGRYSFIQLSRQNETAQTLKRQQRGDSNPGSLDCESGILPLSYRAPYTETSLQLLPSTQSTDKIQTCQVFQTPKLEICAWPKIAGNAKRH